MATQTYVAYQPQGQQVARAVKPDAQSARVSRRPGSQAQPAPWNGR